MKKIKIDEQDLMKQAAKEFVKRGYKVYWWKDRSYNDLSKEDFTSVMITKDGNRVASVGQNKFDGYTVGWNYVPSRGNGSGCRHKDSLYNLEDIIEAIEFVLEHRPWTEADERGSLVSHLKLFDFYSREPLKMEDFEDGDNIEA